METHEAEAHRAFARRRIGGRGHFSRRAVDEVLQHVVEEAHDVFDEGGMLAPLQKALGVDRGEAADGGALRAQVIGTRMQHDLGAQVRLADLQPQFALVPGQGAVHRVGEDQIRLAGLQPQLQHLLPQGAGIDLRTGSSVFGERRAK